MEKPRLFEGKRRFEVLEELGIDDSGPDDWLERITAYCCSRFGVSTCLVSMVDEERHWILTANGFMRKDLASCENFCARVVEEDRLYVVPDAFRDPRLSDDPLVVSGPTIRFYAGTPIRAKGLPIGSLCIIDQEARGLVTEDAADLTEISDAVSWYLTNRKRIAPLENPLGAVAIVDAHGAREVPYIRNGEDTDPWGVAVDYILSHRYTVEARMLGQVAFGFGGSGRERNVRPWEDEMLDPEAVRIAKLMIQAREGAADLKSREKLGGESLSDHVDGSDKAGDDLNDTK